MDKNEFIEKVARVAMENYGEYKLLPSLVIAQAIIESGWGQKAIENNYDVLLKEQRICLEQSMPIFSFIQVHRQIRQCTRQC